MKLGLGNSDWSQHKGSGREDRANQSEEEYETMRKLQFTVASSTFGGIAFVGLFCTCLWLSCCRHKKTSRIRGRTWNTNSSFAIPNGATLANPHMHDPHGLNVNPYLITPTYFSDVNLNTSNGLYHPSMGYPDDVKPPVDNSYKPFFSKPEWNPPQPPSYDTLGFVNPGYETNPTHADMDNNDQIKKTLITEKVLTSILATCDPSKRPGAQYASGSTERAEDVISSAGQPYDHDITCKGSDGNSSAPPESIVSIDSKDGGHPYSNGLDLPKKSEGKLEELTPPPFNPSYLFNNL